MLASLFRVRAFRGIVAALIAVMSFSIIVSVASATVTEDEQWPVPVNYEPTFHGVVVQSGGLALQGTVDFRDSSLLTGVTRSPWNRFVCKSTTDEACSKSKGIDDIAFTSILPVCETATDTDCLLSVSTVGSDGTSVKGVFDRYVSPNHPNNFPADVKIGLPEGSSASVWRLDGAKHAFGVDYAVSAAMIGNIHIQKNNEMWGDSLGVALTPVSMQSGAVATQILCETIQQTPERKNIGCNVDITPRNAKYKCAYAQESTGAQPQCLLSRAFPKDTRFVVTLRLAKEPVGWLHGRLNEPSISVGSASGGVTLTVEAAPTVTPTVYYGAAWSELPDVLREFFLRCESQAIKCAPLGNHAIPPEQRSGTMYQWSHGPGGLEAVKLISPLIGDRAVAMPSAWTFNTLPANMWNGPSTCITNGTGIKGFVSTNSTAYSEGPPEFINGSLNYKVAAPHLDSAGNVFRGDYSLVIRSDVARCLYGFSSAPVSATVQVVNESGENQVATTVMNERGGWLYLRASGFTFSSPTVKVALSQQGVVSTVSRIKPKPAPKTICVKGKLKKTVSGSTCPKGYRKA